MAAKKTETTEAAELQVDSRDDASPAADAGLAELRAQMAGLVESQAALAAALEATQHELATTKKKLVKAQSDATAAAKSLGDVPVLRLESVRVGSVDKARAYAKGRSFPPGKPQNVPPGFTVRLIDMALPKNQQARLRAKFAAMGFVKLPVDELPENERPFMPGVELAEWWIADEAVETVFRQRRFDLRARLSGMFKRDANKALRDEIRKVVAEERAAG